MGQINPEINNNKLEISFGIISLSFLLLGGILVINWIPQLYQIISVPVFLTLHTIIEILGVVVSTAVFIVAWYNFQQTRSPRELIICLTFLAVGVIDFAHALSYNGMPDFFTANSVNKASTYWIFARLIQAVGLLMVVVSNPDKPVKTNPLHYLILTVIAVSAIVVVVIKNPAFLPAMYQQGQGQTTAKIALEYVVILFSIVSFIYLFIRKNVHNSDKYIQAALLFGIFSEIAFTLYSSAYDTYNLLGHIYKLAAFACILRGLFVTSVISLYQSNKILQEQKKNLAVLNAQLEKVNQLKSDFLANTNHELRTPLSAIIGFTEFLLDEETGPLNEVQKDYLQEIQESGQTLLAEINNILDLSKIESGQARLYVESACLDEIIRQVIRQLNPLLTRKQHKVTVNISEDIGQVFVDRDKIRKIFSNLLFNANKYSPAGEEINVDMIVSEDNKHLIVSVRDAGAGLEKQQITHIFNKGDEVLGAPTLKRSGTGLGLTIAEHFVKLHGGNVWVSQEPGIGSTFFFKLPLNIP